MLAWYKTHDDPVWIYPKSDHLWKEQIIKEFKIHPVTAQVLVSRGFTTFEAIHDFLYAKLPDLCDPFLFSEMPQAVDRICLAIQQGENILIYGDNDVDGMTGTALLTDFLQSVGAHVFFYISTPGNSRQSLIVEALGYALKNECKLLITVDCGITAAIEVAKIVEKQIDVIITDHHEPTDKIPYCIATLNPKLIGSNYPNRELTGVGVAFKLAHALRDQLVEDGTISVKKIDLKRFLDLVALGTIADMGNLNGENRILVRYGLRQLRKTKRIGLSKLMTICDIDLNELSAFAIASKLAPRLNSLGRIDDPQKGVELLLVRNSQIAERMAEELDLNNMQRQQIERTISEDIEEIFFNKPDVFESKAIIIHSEKWHPGVIAILASRIMKIYNRPTIVIAIDKGIGKGSLRSIPEFPLLGALKSCGNLLENFGGHDFAAGLTIELENIEKFKKCFIGIAEKQLAPTDVKTKLHLDAVVGLHELTFDFMESIKLLEPFGNGNPQPLLYCNAKQAWPPKVVGKVHLKLYLEQNDRMLEGIGYGKASMSSALRKKNLTLRVAFTPQINDFQGQSIQLLIRDVQPVQ